MEGRVISVEVRDDKQEIRIATTTGYVFKTGEWVKLDQGKSGKQLKFFWAICGDIARHTGDKKIDVAYMLKAGNEVESIREASSEDMNKLIEAAMDIVREQDIPLTRKSVDEMDIEQLLDICKFKKTCMICGKPADMHHVKPVGMGRDRKEADEREPDAPKLPMCRKHHTEIHAYGAEKFCKKYKVEGMEMVLRRRGKIE